MTGIPTNMKPKTTKPKAVEPEAQPVAMAAPTNFLLTLPFEDRMKGFDAEYKALSNKWGVYHLPVNLYDDATTPGGRYGQQLNPDKALGESKPSTEVQ